MKLGFIILGFLINSLAFGQTPNAKERDVGICTPTRVIDGGFWVYLSQTTDGTYLAKVNKVGGFSSDSTVLKGFPLNKILNKLPGGNGCQIIFTPKEATDSDKLSLKLNWGSEDDLNLNLEKVDFIKEVDGYVSCHVNKRLVQESKTCSSDDKPMLGKYKGRTNENTECSLELGTSELAALNPYKGTISFSKSSFDMHIKTLADGSRTLTGETLNQNCGTESLRIGLDNDGAILKATHSEDNCKNKVETSCFFGGARQSNQSNKM